MTERVGELAEQLLEVRAGDEHSAAEGEAGDLATADALVGRGSGDAEDLGDLGHGEGELGGQGWAPCAGRAITKGASTGRHATNRSSQVQERAHPGRDVLLHRGEHVAVGVECDGDRRVPEAL